MYTKNIQHIHCTLTIWLYNYGVVKWSINLCKIIETVSPKSGEAGEPGQAGAMPTRKRFLRKSVLSDWCINFDELSIGNKIGEGRTGQVRQEKSTKEE